MTFPRKIGLTLIVVAILACTAHVLGLALPTLRWFYSFDVTLDLVNSDWKWFRLINGDLPNQLSAKDWIGHAFCGVMILVGLWMVVAGGKFQWNPITLRKFSRFRSIGRGWISYRILLALLFLAVLDQVLVGKRALAVRYDGQWLFPAFSQKWFKESDFGGKGEQEVNYRKLRERFAQEDSSNWVLLAPIPWDPTFDSDQVVKRELVEIDGKWCHAKNEEPYNGEAVRFRLDQPEMKAGSSRFRKGLRDGNATIFNEKQEFVGRQTWHEGRLMQSSVPEGTVEFAAGPWVQEIYPPAPPSLKERHFLGTDSKGWDIAAQMFGGLQVMFKASALYLLLTYGVGILLGGISGYFGGAFDLILQRLIEILANIPFLLVVMIISANLGRDDVNLVTILLIFCAFSWMGVASYLRTSTLKEKARDYVAAARVQGAGTVRVLFHHILPNALSPMVTLLPFSVAAVTSLLTALDFLGFGLPDQFPSWGRVLDDGASNLNSPWIVSSVFFVMVGLLMVITFIGEAIREAFDPKKFTTYR
jgi:microcin C transport system permease protein